MGINQVSIPYPDFKLHEVIDPEQFDLNNKDLSDKINELLTVVNQITDSVADGGSGADKISLTSIAPFTSTKLQAFLEEVVGKLQSTASNNSGAQFVGSQSITGVTGNNVYAQLLSLKGLIDGFQSQITNDVNALNTHKSSADHDSRYYTKSQTDTSLGLKANSTDVYTKTSADSLLSAKADKSTTYTKTETNNLLSAKSDKSDTYTKAEVNTIASGKANSTDVYTRTTTDSLLGNKANLSDVYTKTDTYSQNQVNTLLGEKVNRSETYDRSQIYSKEEVDSRVNTLHAKDDEQDARIDNLVVGSTVDGELIDARVGADAVARSTVGSLIREIHRTITTANSSNANLSQGLNVLNATRSTLLEPTVKGSTLANLWQNAQTEAGKNYIATFPNRNVGLKLDSAYQYTNTKFQGLKTVAPVLMADFTGKVSGSTVENPHLSKVAYRSTLEIPSSVSFGEVASNEYGLINTLNGGVYPYGAGVKVNGNMAQQVFSFNLIRHIEDTYGTIPRSTTADKVQWIKDNVQKITANWHGFGSSPAGNKATFAVWFDGAWGTSTVKTTGVVDIYPWIGLPGVFPSVIDTNGFVHFLAYADPSNGVTASTINTDYINLEVELKPYTPTSTYNDNFVGKVSGSVAENPHKIMAVQKNSLASPSEFSFEYLTADISKVNSLDGQSLTDQQITNGLIMQQLFSFNLLELYKRKTGVTVPGANLAAQVQWLKDNITQLVANWHGFGSSPTGNKASLRMWHSSDLNWVNMYGTDSTSATVSKLFQIVQTSLEINSFVDSNGFVHLLAYAEPSNGTVASTINTDFIDINITVKNTFRNTIRPTKQGAGLYEVDTTTYNLVNVDSAYTGQKLLDKFPYVDGVKHVQNPAVTVQGKNLLPPFTEWTLHANATVKSPYELELNATGQYQSSSVRVPVSSNQTYIISKTGDAGNGNVWEEKSDFSSNGGIGFSNSGTAITTKSDTKFLRIELTNVPSTGTFTFTNPQLELGATATPFEPKNEDVLYASTKLAGTTVKDELYKRDGQWFKLKRWETDVKLDGTKSYQVYNDYTGFKGFLISVTSNSLAVPRNITEKVISHSAESLKNVPDISLMNTANQSYMDINNLVVSVSDVDTGFLEAQTPTVNMVKGYFNGWRYTGNGTTHSWVNIVDGSSAPTQTEAYVSANVAPNYTPYSLTYQLARAVEEPVTVEGAISLHEGLNQVEVTSGVISRERVKPIVNFGTAKINYNGDTTGGKTKEKVFRFIAVYKNGIKDNKWIFSAEWWATENKLGAYIPQADFDPTAEYTVSYIVLDKHLFTANANDVSATYPDDILGSLSKLVESVGDLISDVSVMDRELTYTYAHTQNNAMDIDSSNANITQNTNSIKDMQVLYWMGVM